MAMQQREQKKVGILTFSYSSNPGSVLQAYALQETISEEAGYTASIVNYQKTGADKPIVGRNVFCGSVRKWTLGKIKGWIVRLVAYPMRMRKYEKFFRKYYRGFSSKPYSREALQRVADEYDRFVVGSDQVWNFDSINIDDTYLLDFVKDRNKKISYAASFGQRGVPEQEAEHFAEKISDFSAISVRERYGVATVQELTGRKAEWVLDPSLLRNKEQWAAMAVAPREKNYVFVYLRENSKEIEQYARELAKQHGLEVIKVLLHWKCDKNGRRVQAVGPCEWLGYMLNAKYVITNSFHGICFSLALRKEVYVSLLNGDRASTNARLSSLLGLFEIEDRCIDVTREVVTMEKMDYERIERIKKACQEKSLAFLRQALAGDVHYDKASN